MSQSWVIFQPRDKAKRPGNYIMIPAAFTNYHHEFKWTFLTSPQPYSTFSSSFCSPHPTKGLAEFIILLQPPSLSIPPSFSAVSVVSQTHSSYGPWGTLGLCYILPYKQPNRHPQHARIFPSLFSSYVYFYSLKQNRFLGSERQGPKFSSFCGNSNIVFHEAVPSVLGNSLQTIWSGLFFWSKAVQSERRKGRLRLPFWMQCWQSKKVWSLGPKWTSDPLRVCVSVCVFEHECVCGSYMEMLSFAFPSSWVFWNCKCKSSFWWTACFLWPLLCISESIKSCI